MDDLERRNLRNSNPVEADTVAEKEETMPMSLLETSIYVRPRFPVEFAVRADDIPIRVAIEWDAVVRLMGPASADADRVRDFLHQHRSEIGSAIRAQLAAHGTPLDRQLTMSWNDLRPLVASLVAA